MDILQSYTDWKTPLTNAYITPKHLVIPPPPTLDKYHNYSPYLSIVPHFNGSDKTKKRKKISYFLNNNNWITLSKISWFVDGEQIHYSIKPEAEKKNWSFRHWWRMIIYDSLVQ